MTDELTRITDDDLSLMFPGKEIVFGKSVVQIKPLGFEDVVRLGRRLFDIEKELTKAKIGPDMWGTLWLSGEWVAKLPAFSSVVLAKAPDFFETLFGIHRDSLVKLPINKMIELFSLAVEVNVDSLEGLEKNLGEVVGKAGIFLIHLLGMSGESQTSSAFSKNMDGQEPNSEKPAPAKSERRSEPPSRTKPENSEIWKR